jgi:hypothetical protein
MLLTGDEELSHVAAQLSGRDLTGTYAAALGIRTVQTLFFNRQHITKVLAASILRPPRESALVCPDNKAILAVEQMCHDVTERLDALHSNQREREKCMTLDIS